MQSSRWVETDGDIILRSCYDWPWLRWLPGWIAVSCEHLWCWSILGPIPHAVICRRKRCKRYQLVQGHGTWIRCLDLFSPSWWRVLMFFPSVDGNRDTCWNLWTLEWCWRQSSSRRTFIAICCRTGQWFHRSTPRLHSDGYDVVFFSQALLAWCSFARRWTCHVDGIVWNFCEMLSVVDKKVFHRLFVRSKEEEVTQGEVVIENAHRKRATKIHECWQRVNKSNNRCKSMHLPPFQRLISWRLQHCLSFFKRLTIVRVGCQHRRIGSCLYLLSIVTCVTHAFRDGRQERRDTTRNSLVFGKIRIWWSECRHEQQMICSIL
jgi:hypothetical protein